MYLARHVTVLLLEVISQLFQPLIFTGQEGVQLGGCLPYTALWRTKETTTTTHFIAVDTSTY